MGSDQWEWSFRGVGFSERALNACRTNVMYVGVQFELVRVESIIVSGSTMVGGWIPSTPFSERVFKKTLTFRTCWCVGQPSTLFCVVQFTKIIARSRECALTRIHSSMKAFQHYSRERHTFPITRLTLQCSLGRVLPAAPADVCYEGPYEGCTDLSLQSSRRCFDKLAASLSALHWCPEFKSAQVNKRSTHRLPTLTAGGSTCRTSSGF